MIIYENIYFTSNFKQWVHDKHKVNWEARLRKMKELVSLLCQSGNNQGIGGNSENLLFRYWRVRSTALSFAAVFSGIVLTLKKSTGENACG